ncbi:MAG: Muramoyltetrapeptide carboxypeptidase [Bacteroidota bacterium]|jgi:muramoyltetrapeptide carboxypeptidase
MSQIPLLSKGDKVAILSPASPPKSSNWINGVQILSDWGLEVIFSPNHMKQHFGLAGTDEERISDLQWALDDPSIKAIFPIRGGYGSSRIIDSLNFNLFADSPKWMVGFSDITALLLHLNKLGFASVHGPMPHNFLQIGGENALINLHKLLFQGTLHIKTPSHSKNRYGEATGQVIGGNLSLIVHLIGTPSFPDLNGKILLLEEVGERLYHVDRMLVQLKRAGLLSKLSGLLIGGFTDCEEASLAIGKTINELILEHTKDYNYPIVFDFPSGHIPDNQPIPMGVNTNLLVSSREVQLTYHS